MGDGALSEVGIDYQDNDIHMLVEGEELVVWSLDPEFAPALLGPEKIPPPEITQLRTGSRRGAHLSRSRGER